MANYWGIAIGVNQYQLFQPLMYAQRDAQAIWNYWVEEAGFPVSQTLLLTDISPVFEPGSTSPTRDNIIQAVYRLCQQIQPDDVLWCFFSGYGVRFEGLDYLMPVEGNPAVVQATGIPIRTLFDAFRTAASRKIVLCLDMNRSQGAIASGGVGQETMALAQEAGISLLLSTVPEGFAHETIALRQGLFTATLLEGMRYNGCSTLGQLAQFLGDRLPELSEHHWRPRQIPFVSLPDAQSYLLLTPPPRVPAEIGQSTGELYPSLPPTFVIPDGIGSEGEQANGGTIGTLPSPPLPPTLPPPHNGSNPPPEPSTGEPAIAPSGSDEQFWQRWQRWGGALIGLLMLGVLLQNRGAFNVPSMGLSPSPNPNPVPGSSAIPGGDLNFGLTASPGSSDSKPGHFLAIDNNGLDGNGSDANRPGGSGVGTISSQVEAALRERNYPVALNLLERMPLAEQPPNYAQLVALVHRGLLDEAQISISRKRALSPNNQASDYNTAVQLASLIKPNTPLHAEAQQYIDRWSVTILELAKSRAIQPNQGATLVAAQNYNDAIAAAQLVPASRPQVYREARQWIDRWSQTLLAMAQSRAAEGRMDIAVQAAQLIPPNTPTYAAAQQAIAQWQ